MPVFDSEDGLALQAGDVDGLLLAANALRQPPAVPVLPAAQAVVVKSLPGQASAAALPALRQVVGIPVGQLTATADGQRIAVAMKGWGNNLFVLNAEGGVLNADVAGKYFPLDVVAMPDGFWLTSYENDPTCAYWKHYDRRRQADPPPGGRRAALRRRARLVGQSPDRRTRSLSTASELQRHSRRALCRGGRQSRHCRVGSGKTCHRMAR